ncbi:MAG: PAS domain S-box protein [Bacteroidales bacterium]|nr:PAS domain S-box protein [Bacteroidales bacterium]
MKNDELNLLMLKAKNLLYDDKVDLNDRDNKEFLTNFIQQLYDKQLEIKNEKFKLENLNLDLDFEKEKFIDLFNNTTFGYLLLNDKLKIIDFNLKTAEFFNASVNYFTDKNFLSFIPENKVDDFSSFLKTVFLSKGGIQNEIEISFKDDTNFVKILKFEGNLLFSKKFNNNLCRLIISDITAEFENRKKANELFDRLENSMIGGDMAWWELQLPSGKIFFNSNKTDMLGYDVADFKCYNDFMNIVHPNDYSKTMDAMYNHLYGKEKYYKCEYRIKNKKGKYLWFYDIGQITQKEGQNIIINGIVSNITEKKHQDEILQSLNEELRITLEELVKVNETISIERNKFLEILNIIPQYVYVTDPDFNILFANKELNKLFGRDIEGEKCYNVLLNKTSVCEKCDKNIIFDSKKSFLNEEYNPFLKKHLYAMFTEITWFDGSKARLEISTDISPIKEAQQKLKDSEEKYRLLVDKSPIGIVQIDSNAIVTDWNKQMEIITGMTKKDVQNQYFWNISARLATQNSQDIEKYVENQIKQTIITGKADWLDKTIETKYKDAKNNIREVETKHFVIPSSTGNRLGAVIQDVTEKNLANRALRESEENLVALINNVPLAVFVHQPNDNGKFILVNKTAEKYTGYSKDELLNMKVSDIDYDSVDRDDQTNIWETLEYGKTYNLESKHVRKDKSVYDAEIIFSLINFKNKPTLISVVNDITERKINENLLIDLNATKDKFFSIIAHDLKNPFNSILGFSNLLLKNIEKYDKDKIKKFIDSIYQSSKNTYKLLETLLEWAKSQSGKISFSPEEINIKQLFDETIGTLLDQARTKKINIVFHCDDTEFVVGDFYMLSTILRNLTSNAIKFSPSNSEITLKVVHKKSKIVFSVADAGVGMSEDKLEKLFKIGEKITSLGTNNEQGSGLGLLLSKEFVTKHNGKIWAESIINEGSTFYFSIPHIL